MHDEFGYTRRDIRARVREGVKAVFEEVLEEEMTEHLRAERRERTDRRPTAGRPQARGAQRLLTSATSSRRLARSSSCASPATARPLS